MNVTEALAVAQSELENHTFVESVQVVFVSAAGHRMVGTFDRSGLVSAALESDVCGDVAERDLVAMM